MQEKKKKKKERETSETVKVSRGTGTYPPKVSVKQTLHCDMLSLALFTDTVNVEMFISLFLFACLLYSMFSAW